MLPLPGRGSYPNIQVAGAYRVQVAPDGSPLDVRTGPGLGFGIITRKSAGAKGWAYQVSIDTTKSYSMVESSLGRCERRASRMVCRFAPQQWRLSDLAGTPKTACHPFAELERQY